MAEHTVLREETLTIELSDGEPLVVTRRLIDVDAGYAEELTYEEVELVRNDDDDPVTFRITGDDVEKLVAFLKRKL